MRKNLVLSVFSFLLCACLGQKISAQVRFERPEINDESKILFTLSHNLTETFSYKTLFMADAMEAGNVKILTCFPEKLEVLSNGEVLQVRNRYGTARYSVQDSSLAWVHTFEELPAFAKNASPISVSPDGKWGCYVKKNSPSQGTLCLKNMSTFEEFFLGSDCDFDFEEVPVKWSPDSAFFVYEKDGSLYFGDPRAAYQKVQLDEEFRRIGEGSITSVSWASSKYLVYIKNDLIYKISSKELYTRTLYSSLVGSGIVVGRLPLGFDFKTDRFWVDSLVSQIVTVNSNSVVSSYRLGGITTSYLESVYSKPFKDLKGSVVDYDVFFCEDGSQLLWVNLIALKDGKRNATVYRLASNLREVARIENASRPIVSPNGKKVAFATSKTLFVYDLEKWQQLGKLSGEKVCSCAWGNNSTLYVGGDSSVREWKSENGKFLEEGKILFLSSVRSGFWKSKSSNLVFAQGNSKKSSFYEYDSVKNIWKETVSEKIASERPVQNSNFRVFTGVTDNKLFENALYVRNFSGHGSTSAVFPETVRKASERKKVALAFDALDSDEGLTHILSTLSKYNIKATFFLNGEFIRRYPLECKQIFESGHECASMYFTVADLSKKGYIIDDEFIRRGLARNEDEFFAATGKELSLMWHAPFYKASPKIKKAGEASGYRYVDADSEELSKAGKIISINVASSDSEETDYTYEKLSLLIGNLLDDGYDFTLVRNIR